MPIKDPIYHMDVWHRVGRFFRITNIGTLIFFALNISLLYFILGSEFSFIAIVIMYALIILISLSPVGEYILCIEIGAEEIKRADYKIHIIPLVEIVLERAKEKSMYYMESVEIKVIHSDKTNAFALGRKTLCITDGLLELPDNIVMGVIAHEIGHLAYGHTVVQLLIGGGNIFISGFLFLIKLSIWIITVIMGLFSAISKSWAAGIFTGVFATISFGCTWIWTKFCKLFLMWSMRQNEYVADEYAVKLGFGYELAYALDNQLCDIPHNGFLKALYNTHPSNDDRIAAIQKLGVNYSHF